MGRIRTIKPEFPMSESVGRLSRDARLLYIQLWTLADDAGRLRASPKLLAGQLYPFDDDARDLVDVWLKELEGSPQVEDSEMIRIYVVSGTTYLDIPKFLEHQKIDRPSASRLPAFDDDSTNYRRTLDERSLRAGAGADTRSKILGTRSSSKTREEKHKFPIHAFDQWWDHYPHKIGKGAAEKKWHEVRKAGIVSFDDLTAGLDRYVQSKPPERSWCNPATWLHQHRWLDEEGPAAKPNGSGKKSMATIAMEMAEEAGNGSDNRGTAGTGDGLVIDHADADDR